MAEDQSSLNCQYSTFTNAATNYNINVIAAYDEDMIRRYSNEGKGITLNNGKLKLMFHTKK